MLLSKGIVCCSKKPKFIKEEVAFGFLSPLVIRTSCSLLWAGCDYWEIFCSKCMTMSNIINNLLLEIDKFMPDMSSRQSVFSHRARGKKSNMSKQEKTSDMSKGKK